MPATAADAPRRGLLAHEFSELASVTRSLFLNWPILNMVLGVTIASFGSYGSGGFTTPFFARAFGDPEPDAASVLKAGPPMPEDVKPPGDSPAAKTTGVQN